MKQILVGITVKVYALILTLLLILTLTPISALEYTFQDTFDSEDSLDNWTNYAVDWDPDDTNESIITSPLNDTWKVVDGMLETTISAANLKTEHLWREDTMAEGAWSFDVIFEPISGTGVVFTLAKSSYGIPNWNQITTSNFDENETSFDLNFHSTGLRLDHAWVEDGKGVDILNPLTNIDWKNGFAETVHHIDILIKQETLFIYVDGDSIVDGRTFTRDYTEVTAFGLWAWGPLSLDNIAVTPDYEGKLAELNSGLEELDPGNDKSNLSILITLPIGIAVVATLMISYKFYFSKKKESRI